MKTSETTAHAVGMNGLYHVEQRAASFGRCFVTFIPLNEDCSVFQAKINLQDGRSYVRHRAIDFTVPSPVDPPYDFPRLTDFVFGEFMQDHLLEKWSRLPRPDEPDAPSSGRITLTPKDGGRPYDFVDERGRQVVVLSIDAFEEAKSAMQTVLDDDAYVRWIRTIRE